METLEQALAAIKTMQTEMDAERARMKDHADKLIEEKRKVTARNAELEEGESAKKLAELADQIDKLKSGGNTEELANTYEQRLADAQAAHDKRIADAEEKAKQADARANAMVAKADLNAAIAGANISTPLVEAFTALLSTKGVEVNTQGDAPYAMIEGRKVGDWVGDYVKTDAGKHFVSAPGNGGGGGSEPSTTGGAGGKAWADMSLSEQTAAYKADPNAARTAMNKAA